MMEGLFLCKKCYKYVNPGRNLKVYGELFTIIESIEKQYLNVENKVM
mgnify:FL=1